MQNDGPRPYLPRYAWVNVAFALVVVGWLGYTMVDGTLVAILLGFGGAGLMELAPNRFLFHETRSYRRR